MAASPLRLTAARLPTLRQPAIRHFTSAARRLDAQPGIAQGTVPARKPVGAFRGGLTGFLLGSTLSGAAMYYYVLNEYRVSNELLTEDIFNLQSTVQRVESYVRVLEDKVDGQKKK